MRLRAVGAAPHGRAEPGRVRPRGDRGQVPGQARAAVLVLLRLQRLEQPARGRLGDDPAHLRRRQRRSGPHADAHGCRLQPAFGRGGHRVGERRHARDRRRHPPGRPSRRGLARELLRRGPLPGKLDDRGRRVRRHPRGGPGPQAHGVHDPERQGRGRGQVPVDHVRGALGRASTGVLQRPDRAEHEGLVDRADQLVAGSAPPEHRASLRGGASAPSTTDFFCTAIGGGSRALQRFLHAPLQVGIVIA